MTPSRRNTVAQSRHRIGSPRDTKETMNAHKRVVKPQGKSNASTDQCLKNDRMI